jgi:DNA-binding NarL/FixJ family response regulator
MSKLQTSEILRRWAVGTPVSKLAETYGCSEATIRSIVYRHATLADRRSRAIAIAEYEQYRRANETGAVKELKAKGLSVSEIAEETGLAVSRVRVLLGPIYTRHKYPKAERVQSLLDKGFSRGQIADKLKVPIHIIRRVIITELPSYTKEKP